MADIFDIAIAKALSGGGGGGGVSTDYITLSWTTDHGTGGDINGTFCGYEFKSSFSFVRDEESYDVNVVLGEIIPSQENPLPEEMVDICFYMLKNRLWGMFGNGTETLYDAFYGFDGAFTVSL